MDFLEKRHITMIGFIDLSNPGLAGLASKMNGQLSAFRKLGHHVELITLKEGFLVDDQGQRLKKLPWIGKRHHFFKFLLDYLCEPAKKTDILYIRYPFSTPSFLRFIKNLTSRKAQVRYVLEIPTMPYDLEFRGIHYWKRLVDGYLRKKLAAWVDLAVVMGNNTSFPGIKSVFLTNGVEITDCKFEEESHDEKVQMVALGQWKYWHGLDRVIKGMASYYRKQNTREVVLTIIGEGDEVKALKEMVKSYSLEKKVTFWGNKTEEEVEQICLMQNIGIGVLGSHRKGLTYHCPLKHRTYAKHGLPFVYSTNDPDFDEAGFTLSVEQGDSPLDIDLILDFLEKVGQSRTEICEFVREKLSWTQKMQKVLDVLYLQDAK